MKNLPAKLKVRVNKTNIRRGKKGDVETCAVARAVQRTIQAKRRGSVVEVGGANSISVYNGWYKEANYIASTPREQKRIDDFISNFDDKKSKVKPCSFWLKLDLV